MSSSSGWKSSTIEFVATPLTTLFISDLHLSPERPAIVGLFLKFLRERASRAEALYILGDLFEYWIGDDAGLKSEARPLVDALRALTGAGIPVKVLHGNRDFLLGEQFEKESGCQLVPDPSVISLYGNPTLIMHGDLLCTDDTDYLKFRTMVRDPQWIKMFLAMPVPDRIAMAQKYREVSKEATANKRPEIMDVNPAAVELAMTTHRVHHLIHGHTHRPARHEINIDGHIAYRTVLGDWYDQGSVLVCEASGCRLEGLAS